MEGPLDRICRIALVDDHPGYRAGLRAFLRDWPHGEVVLEAANGVEYEEACAHAGPIDIALVDLMMPLRDGIRTIAWICTNQPATRPIALSFSDELLHFREARCAGARALLCKSANKETIIAALEHVRLTGHHHNELMERVLSGEGAAVAPKRILREITPMQHAFLDQLCAPDDPTYDQIAKRMRRSPHTIETWRKQLFLLFGVNSRVALFRAAERLGLIGRSRLRA